jgi:hypothetical protein
MHLSGTVVDLYMTYANGSGTALSFQTEFNLTEYRGPEGNSGAAQYVPASGIGSAS